MQFPFSHQVNPAYTLALCQRLNTGVVVQPAVVSIGHWEPQPNRCHENVTTWCENNPDFQVVRGWLYMDMAAQLHYEVFIAHSVVRDSEGRLWDITPAQAFANYPFIAATEPEDEYASFIAQGASRLLHYK